MVRKFRRVERIETARRLGCDGSLVGIVEDAAERRPQDPSHHVRHWAEGGETKLDNLITLCRFHHHLVHEGGYGLRCTDDGAFGFARPDGEPLAETIPVEKCFRGNMLAAGNRERGIAIEAGTIDSRWLGEQMDYGMAIDALLAKRDKPTHSAVNGSP